MIRMAILKMEQIYLLSYFWLDGLVMTKIDPYE